MPINLNFFERMLMLWLNQAPAPTLDMYGVIANRAVSVGLKLGLFEVLQNNAMTSKDVASKLNVNERGIHLLLEALEAIGYLSSKNGFFANTAMTKKWLLCDSPSSIANLFEFFDSVIERCGYLEETIRNGKPPITGWEWFDQHPGLWDKYYAGMLDGARLASDEVVSKVKIPSNAQRLLDVGGGHGYYSIKFCQAYPGLTATVFDWPQALMVAKMTIAEADMRERITLQAGDVWIDNLGSEYDAALLFNMVHMYAPDKNNQLIRRVAESLTAGGMLVIMDQIGGQGSGCAAKSIARLQSLQLFNSVKGQTYLSREIAGWLRNAGFENIQTKILRRAPSSGLVMGTRKI